MNADVEMAALPYLRRIDDRTARMNLTVREICAQVSSIAENVLLARVEAQGICTSIVRIDSRLAAIESRLELIAART